MWADKVLPLAHVLDNANHSIGRPIVIVLAFGSWIVGFTLMVRAQRNRKPNQKLYPPAAYYTALTAFIAVIFSELLVVSVIKWAAFEEIKPRLFSRVISVTVDGKGVQDISSLVAALRDVRNTLGHHSHPTTVYRVELVTAKGPLLLYLARDSGDPHEYWTTNPYFRNGYVGQVVTSALDKR